MDLETTSPFCANKVPLKGGGDKSVKGQAVRGAGELQREVFNEQTLALMEIVFHTPLSSLIPSVCVCACARACACV